MPHARRARHSYTRRCEPTCARCGRCATAARSHCKPACRAQKVLAVHEGVDRRQACAVRSSVHRSARPPPPRNRCALLLKHAQIYGICLTARALTHGVTLLECACSQDWQGHGRSGDRARGQGSQADAETRSEAAQAAQVHHARVRRRRAPRKGDGAAQAAHARRCECAPLPPSFCGAQCWCIHTCAQLPDLGGPPRARVTNAACRAEDARAPHKSKTISRAAVTPGTPFMAAMEDAILEFAESTLEADPQLEVVVSGCSVPVRTSSSTPRKLLVIVGGAGPHACCARRAGRGRGQGDVRHARAEAVGAARGGDQRL